MRKFIAMLAALMALVSSPAWAQNAQPQIEILSLQAHPTDIDIGKPKTWVRPNVDPYSGDVAGAAFLGKVTDIRLLELKEAWSMRIRGECHRYQFGPKDVFRTTFGKDRSMLAKPGFTGWADVCIVRSDGTALVFPEDCKNIGPAQAVFRRKEPAISQPQRQVVITTTVAPRMQEGSVVTPFPFFGFPGTAYSRGGINVGSRSSSSAEANAPGCKTACAPTNPNHRP